MAIIRNDNYKAITLMTSVLVENVFVSRLKLCYWLHWLNFFKKNNPMMKSLKLCIPSSFSKFFIQLTFTCSKSTIGTQEKRCEICSKLTIITPERRQFPLGILRSPLGPFWNHVSRSAILLRLCSQTGNATVLKIRTVIFKFS